MARVSYLSVKCVLRVFNKYGVHIMFKYKLVKEDSCFKVMRKLEVLALTVCNIYGASVIIKSIVNNEDIVYTV